MAYNFVAVDREQLMLMPPSVADWLPEDHLAWFVLDVVAELDLTGFLSGYRADGRGGAAYDPAMMLAVLIYAYCTGERSSRRIERRLVEDVAFRVVAANQQPDHATIARFRATHETAIASLFAQVLAVCAGQGLLRPGLVAIDGTRMVANASKEANRTAEQVANLDPRDDSSPEVLDWWGSAWREAEPEFAASPPGDGDVEFGEAGVDQDGCVGP
jgi:transposase